jgi:hypothetical protein
VQPPTAHRVTRSLFVGDYSHHHGCPSSRIEPPEIDLSRCRGRHLFQHMTSHPRESAVTPRCLPGHRSAHVVWDQKAMRVVRSFAVLVAVDLLLSLDSSSLPPVYLRSKVQPGDCPDSTGYEPAKKRKQLPVNIPIPVRRAHVRHLLSACDGNLARATSLAMRVIERCRAARTFWGLQLGMSDPRHGWIAGCNSTC